MTEVAHLLGMYVIIEGVDTAAQLERVRELGCDAVQGWVFARAGAPERIADWFAAE